MGSAAEDIGSVATIVVVAVAAAMAASQSPGGNGFWSYPEPGRCSFPSSVELSRCCAQGWS